MLVKNLPGKTLLKEIGIKIPDNYKEIFKDAGVHENVIYIISSWHCGIWIKTKKDSTRVYPIIMTFPAEILDWEIVDEDLTDSAE